MCVLGRASGQQPRERIRGLLHSRVRTGGRWSTGVGGAGRFPCSAGLRCLGLWLRGGVRQGWGVRLDLRGWAGHVGRLGSGGHRCYTAVGSQVPHLSLASRFPATHCFPLNFLIHETGVYCPFLFLCATLSGRWEGCHQVTIRQEPTRESPDLLAQSLGPPVSPALAVFSGACGLSAPCTPSSSSGNSQHHLPSSLPLGPHLALLFN